MNHSLGLYVHVPFCEKKCDYCDFYSLPGQDERAFDAYVDSLVKEIDLYRGILRHGVGTVFFGGGTPSLLGTNRILTILDRIRPYVLEGAEVSLECNPESVPSLRVEEILAGGINRFSMGVQSGSDRLLKVMGRIHSVEKGIDAFRHLREGGARNVNLDFISSVPTETMDDVAASLTLIEELAPEHVSLYSLIVEPGTPFYRRYGKEEVLREEIDRAHVHAYGRGLAALGYNRYEISNFEKGGHPCAHNVHYWHLGEYVGIGPGASGHLNKRRYSNVRNMADYEAMLAREEVPIAEEEMLSPLDRDNEYTMLGLRLNEGIPLYGTLPSGGEFQAVYKDAIEKNKAAGLLYIEREHVVLTEKGRDLANRVELDFFRLPE